MQRRHKRDQDGIFERPDSPYWWIATPDGRGSSTRRSSGIRRDQDPQGLKARAIRAAWLAENPPVEIPAGPTFDDLLLRYLSAVTPGKRAPERDRWSARALLPHFTGRELATVGAADVRGYIATRQAAGVGPGTINREIGLMSAALNWARMELEWDVPNAWGCRRLQEPAGRARYLTHAEAAALLAEADRRTARAPWLGDFIRVCLYAGLRSGEALGLEWSRVNLAGRLIQFSAENQKNGRGGTVPINDSARAAILARASYRASHCPASPWVFCRQDGTRVKSIKKGFSAAVAAAGLEDVHPHDLRRTCGSWLVQAGLGIERVSKMLRHADVSVTARVYAHLRPSDIADAAGVLDGIRCEVSRSSFTLTGNRS